MAILRRWRWTFAFAIVWLPAVASGQQCVDPIEVSFQQRARRDTAIRFMQVVNALEARSHKERGTYVSLYENGAPTAPVGFVPRLVFDRWGYLIIVKDLFDSCGFALNSDEHGVVYEARPTTLSPPAN
jgi:hypothetical protein